MPVTTSDSPLIMALNPAFATSRASSFFSVPTLVSIMSARRKNSVSVAPGIRQVTVTPVSKLLAQRERERIEEGLAGVVDRLETARREAGDRSRDQDTSGIAPEHFVADAMDQIERSRDIGVHHTPDALEILVDKRLAEAHAGIRQQRVDRPASGRCAQLVHPLCGRQIRLHRLDTAAEAAELRRGAFNSNLVGGDDEIEAGFGGTFRKFQTYAGRCSRDQGELLVWHDAILDWNVHVQSRARAVVPIPAHIRCDAAILRTTIATIVLRST
jgi:hypothetical protein